MSPFAFASFSLYHSPVLNQILVSTHSAWKCALAPLGCLYLICVRGLLQSEMNHALQNTYFSQLAVNKI